MQCNVTPYAGTHMVNVFGLLSMPPASRSCHCYHRGNNALSQPPANRVEFRFRVFRIFVHARHVRCKIDVLQTAKHVSATHSMGLCRSNVGTKVQVTTEGDAFIVAFHDPIDAVGWALHLQLALLEAPWPPELLQHEKARVETCPEGKLLFRGLRVRVAINTGTPSEIIVSVVILSALGTFSQVRLVT